MVQTRVVALAQRHQRSVQKTYSRVRCELPATLNRSRDEESIHMTASPLTVGIVADEFLDPALGRLGGFGWAARRFAEVFNRSPELGVRPVYLSGAPHRARRGATKPLTSNGTRLVRLGNRLPINMLRLLGQRVDVLITIDYRRSYDRVLKALPFTPVITWVRDPRTPADIEKMYSLRIPGREGEKPKGLHAQDTTKLAAHVKGAWFVKRKVLLANKMPHMIAKDEETYGLPPSPFVLPNPSLFDYEQTSVQKSERPSVAFLARLDPIKRPWLFVDLARRFSGVDFLMMGQAHFEGEGGWAPSDIPSNLHLLGYLSSEEKRDVLARAWVLVNTSIHEETPVSVLEALAHETPVISYEDWGKLVARHGITIGQHYGTGEQGLADLEAALRELLTNNEKRAELGARGRVYVESTHNDEQFLAAFWELCNVAGVAPSTAPRALEQS